MCDAVAVAVVCGLGEVLAVAACVKPRRSQAGQAVEQVIDDLPLLRVRDVAQLDRKRHMAAGIGGDLQRHQYREVAVPREVHAKDVFARAV